MSKTRLTEHYASKYAQESESPTLFPINSTPLPTDRFEAAKLYIEKYFRGSDVLELGAGNGQLAKSLLLSPLPIDSYTLNDFCVPRLEGLQRNLRDKRVQILPFDVEHLDSAHHQLYDLIIMTALIEHFIDPMRTMSVVRKLIRPGGFVYIDTPNVAKYTKRLLLLAGRFPSTASINEGLTTYGGKPSDMLDEGHLAYFTHRSLRLMLTQRCGFSRTVNLSYPSGPMPLGKHVHSTLARLRPSLFSDIVMLAYA